MTRTKKMQTCAMCGGEASTKDHIPPQSLYPKPRQPNLQLHTVPACKTCNNGASMDDEEFKMIVGVSTGQAQPNQDAIVNSLQATMAANDRLNRIVRSGKQIITIDRGYAMPGAVVIPFEGPSYDRVVQRMIRGLYWREKMHPLGLETNVQVIDPSRTSLDLVTLFKDLLPTLAPKFLNDRTFCYKVGFSSDGSSVWALQMFGKHTVFGMASRPENGSINA
jgi:hypothetical protein